MNPHVLSDTRPKPCASTSSATGPPEAVGASIRTERRIAPLIQKSRGSIRVALPVEPVAAVAAVAAVATRPDRTRTDYRRVVLVRLAIRPVLGEVLLPRRGRRKHHHHPA